MTTSNKKATASVGLFFILWIVAWIAGWLWTSLGLVMPWLISLELVKWAAAIVALAGMAFVFFWIFIFVTTIITAISGMFAD